MSLSHTYCSRQRLKRGLWSPDEDEKLVNYVTTHGHGGWSTVPKLAGLQRCGKSCRLRWINYLRPDLKSGNFTSQEVSLIIDLHRVIGNRWAQIARSLPGRTDNDVKKFWNRYIKKKLLSHHNLTRHSNPTALPPFPQNPHYNPNFDSVLMPPSATGLPPLPDSYTINYNNPNHNSIDDQSFQIGDYQPFDGPVQDNNIAFNDQDLDFLEPLMPEMRGIADVFGCEFPQGQGGTSFDPTASTSSEQLHPTHIKNITSLMESFAPPGSFPPELWDEPFPATSSFTGSSSWGPHP